MREALVDPESVGARLRRLEQLLAVLEEVHEQGRARLLHDVRIQLQTEHALQIAIQICIDVGIHIASERALRPPEDYRGVFASLAVAGVLDRELAERLGDATGLRNLLVHEYTTVDHGQLWDALDDLDDLRAFAAAAAREAEL
jgi:uncharacterized protein YutE (UPF0331/DUF86 family)